MESSDTVFQMLKDLLVENSMIHLYNSDLKHFPFSVIENKGKPVDSIKYSLWRKTIFTPEEISSGMILGKMRDIAVSSLFFSLLRL